MEKKTAVTLFGILALLMGAVSGAAVWCILKIMDLGIRSIWGYIPKNILGVSETSGALVYSLAICMAGGLLIGSMQRRYGPLPDDLHQVMGKIKREGGYPYDKLHVIAATALLPLIFGGAIGPEAGLSGFIAGMCTLIGDRLKYKGDKLAAMAETGSAAALGVIFGAPLFGIIGNLEPDDRGGAYRKKLLSKKGRIFIYCMGTTGGFLAMGGLGALAGGTGGLPRFAREHADGLAQWGWSFLLIGAGISAAVLFLVVDRVTAYVSGRLKKHTICCAVLAGGILGVVGHFVPEGMFSGEEQMAVLMGDWASYSVEMLLLIAFVKIFLVHMCINFGWRGGSIFPMIFSGAAVGYAMALAVGLDGGFAVAMVVSAMCGFVMKKPLSVVAILLLCFPVTYIIPIAVSAFISSKMAVLVQRETA